MKVFGILVLFAIVAYASSKVVPEVIYDGLILSNDGKIINLEDVETDAGSSSSTEVSPIRHRRVTCDLSSVTKPGEILDHVACAERCLGQRHKGGVCMDGVCHCRD